LFLFHDFPCAKVVISICWPIGSNTKWVVLQDEGQGRL